MGLDQFQSKNAAEQQYKKYNKHDLDEYLEELVEHNQHRFPERVEVDFIEASPSLESTYGMAYYRRNGGDKIKFIRIADWLADRKNRRLEMVVVHEMCHIFLYQKGFTDVNEKDDLFQWILGRTNADLTHMNYRSKKYEEVVEPFTNMQSSQWHTDE